MVRMGCVCGLMVVLGIPSSGSTFVTDWRRDVFTIHASAPPAALLVARSDGKRAGADPTKPISAVGLGTTIDEFPLADVEQQNIATDGPDGPEAPGPVTGWYVRIKDESPATYAVQLRGLAAGIAELDISMIIRQPPSPLVRKFKRSGVLLSPGDLKEFAVTSDRDAQIVRAERLVAPGGLVESVRTACTLGLVASDGVCRSLSAKAEAVRKACLSSRTDAKNGPIKAFLNELTAQGYKHVKEPALTILREEAEALLNPPSSSPKPKKKPKTAGAVNPAK